MRVPGDGRDRLGRHETGGLPSAAAWWPGKHGQALRNAAVGGPGKAAGVGIGVVAVVDVLVEVVAEAWLVHRASSAAQLARLPS
jgi:hypothetical protein